VQPLALIPSPSQSSWHLGSIPIRAYALCIVAGIIVAIVIARRRWHERGGVDDDIWDVAGWAIVFGIIGGRLYHVITDPELYFKKGEHPLDAFKIWDGGLGIWGAIALGAVGAWIGCRRHGMKLTVFADAAAPGVLVAQAIGRWGNWFNNELYGGPTSLPWGLRVHCMDIVTGHAVPFGTADGGQVCDGTAVVHGLYQPTFLYESLWDLAIAALLIYLDRRFRLGKGTVFALYVMGYTAGRGWIEALRHDHANHILGLRLNDWTAVIVFLLGLALFVHQGGFHSGRDESPYTEARRAAEAEKAGTDSAGASGDDAPSGEVASGEGASGGAESDDQSDAAGVDAKMRAPEGSVAQVGQPPTDD
jgi:prolipoprotein diacylglyceryl transferase